MKIRYFHIVLFFLVYFTVEDFVLKVFSFNLLLLGLMRVAGELALYATFFIFLVNRVRQNRWHRKTPIDLYLYSMIIIFLVASLSTPGKLVANIIAVRTLFRYIVVFYLLASITISKEDILVFIHTVIIVSSIQATLAIVQHLLGREFTMLFLPVESDLSVGGVQKEFRILSLGDHVNAIGTFGHTVPLAIFLVFTSCILFAQIFYKNGAELLKALRIKKGRVWVILGLIVLATLLTFTRASFLAILLLFPVIAVVANSIKRFVSYTVLASFAGFVVIAVYLLFLSITGGAAQKVKSVIEKNPAADLAQAFSPEYIQKEASNNRIWVVKNIGGANLAKPNIFGYGGDWDQTRLEIYRASGGTLRRILFYPPIKDVYWITILTVYGFVGFTLFVLILVKIWRAARYLWLNGSDNLTKGIALSMQAIMIAMVILSFFVVTFEFRPVAYLFWAFSGLIINQFLALKAEERDAFPSAQH